MCTVVAQHKNTVSDNKILNNIWRNILYNSPRDYCIITVWDGGWKAIVINLK